MEKIIIPAGTIEATSSRKQPPESDAVPPATTVEEQLAFELPSLKATRPGDNPETEIDHVYLVALADIIDNPLNTTLYDSGISSGLLASIEQVGILEPVKITPAGLLIDGHMRKAAALQCGYKKIPAIIQDIAENQHLETMLAYNRQRIKSNPERIREYRAYLEIERTRASDRAGNRTDLGITLPPGQVYGKSRDIAASYVGLSGSSAERGLRVLEELERREQEGRTDGTGEVIKALHDKINAAFKLAQRYGWLDPAFKRKQIPCKSGNSQHVEKTVSKPISQPGISPVLIESEAGYANTQGWITAAIISGVLAKEPCLVQEADHITTAMLLLRPALYAATGVIKTAETGAKLRRIARLLTGLAELCEIEDEPGLPTQN